MKTTWIQIVALTIFIQPTHTQTKWKQIPESPFAIKSIPEDQDVENGPRQVAFSPDGSFLTVANAFDSSGTEPASGSISVFSVNKKTGLLIELENSPFKTESSNRTLGLAFSLPTVPTLTTANKDDVTKLFSFNTQTGELFNLRPANDGPCTNTASTAVAYSPNGKHLATISSSDAQVNVYHVNQTTGDLACQQETDLVSSFTRSIAYYPVQSDSSFVAIIANTLLSNSDIVIFTANPETGVISNPKDFFLRGGQDILPHWVTFSPNGRFLAVAVADGVEVRRFRATGIYAPTLLPLNNPTSFFPTSSLTSFSGVRSVAYSPNGKWLAAANGNETISVFCVDQETGALFNRQDLIVGHTGDLGADDFAFSVIFSPDNNYIAVSNRNDNSISVFTNPSIGCPTCNTILNLSNNSSCAACTDTVN